MLINLKAAKPGSGGKKKKRKTPTDVNAPKKPVSAYITYLNERRETVRPRSKIIGDMGLSRLQSATRWPILEGLLLTYPLSMVEWVTRG